MKMIYGFKKKDIFFVKRSIYIYIYGVQKNDEVGGLECQLGSMRNVLSIYNVICWDVVIL